MRKVENYVLISDINTDDFQSKIVRRIQEGYELYGQTFIDNDKCPLFYQPMVKYRDQTPWIKKDKI
jgi:hypothetical protein